MNSRPRRHMPAALSGTALALLVMLAVVPATLAAQSTSPATVGEIVVDGYDCDTGQLQFRVPVSDVPHDPDDDGSIGYSVVGHYAQGPDSAIPGLGYNVPEEDAPYTGDFAPSATVPPTNVDFLEAGDIAGTITSIDIKVGVGYEGGAGPSDTSRTTYEVDCGGAVPTAASSDGTGAGDAGAASEPVTDDTTELPNTGAGRAAGDAPGPWLATLLGSLAVVLMLCARRVRAHA